MTALIRIAELLGRYMAPIVVAVGAIVLFKPELGLWISTSWFGPLLMVIMFGMGLTLKTEDFRLLVTRPKDIIIGCIAQFTVMPLLAYGLGCLFQLDAALMAGVVLVGTCPGGTASNVITYLSKGDVALSVGITSVNTLLAPLLTPLITWLLLRASVTVDFMTLFISIIKVVVIPIALGYLINLRFGKQTQKYIGILPGISVTAIAIIIAGIIAHNAQKILDTGYLVVAVVVLHNLLGFACGFCAGMLFRMERSKIKAVAIEIGMQNSGLAASLAGMAFPNLAMATVPGAIFSVWHNISGAVLASIFRKWTEKQKIPSNQKDIGNNSE